MNFIFISQYVPELQETVQLAMP